MENLPSNTMDNIFVDIMEELPGDIVKEFSGDPSHEKTSRWYQSWKDFQVAPLNF